MSYPSDPYGANQGWQGQPPGYGAQPGPQPDNYLVWAILSTVLCCLPLGIVSIVYSNKVSSLWAQGQYGAAQAASASAKKWAMISAIVGVVGAVIGIIFYIIMAVVIVSNAPSTTFTTYSSY